MDAVIGNYGDWFQVPKVTGRCSSPVLSVFDGYVKISMGERNGFFPSRFQGSQTVALGPMARQCVLIENM